MNKTVLLEKYPVYAEEIDKGSTPYPNINEVMAHFKQKIEAHPVASYIGEFDHYAHVAKQPNAKIAEGIRASQHILFCVANAIPNPLIAAVRPRALSVTEFEDKYVISFLEAPVEPANELISGWVESLKVSASEPL
jgi:hypothetical protein